MFYLEELPILSRLHDRRGVIRGELNGALGLHGACGVPAMKVREEYPA